VHVSSSITLINISNKQVISRDIRIFPFWISFVYVNIITLALVCVSINGLGALGLALVKVSLAKLSNTLLFVMLLTFKSFLLAKHAL